MELVGTSLSRAMNAMAFLPGAEATKEDSKDGISEGDSGWLHER